MAKPESSYGELFLLEEQTAEEHDEGFHFRLFPEQLDCIRRGDIVGLKRAFPADFDEYYKTVLNNL